MCVCVCVIEVAFWLALNGDGRWGEGCHGPLSYPDFALLMPGPHQFLLFSPWPRRGTREEGALVLCR